MIPYDHATTDHNHLSFRHGYYACPGRYITSAKIKMALTKMLLRYDLKFTEMQGRPQSLTEYGLSFNGPDGRMMARQRVKGAWLLSKIYELSTMSREAREV
jgi:hypothetical protein